MKKLIASIMTVSLMAAMSATALAAGTVNNGDHPVNGTYKPGASSPVYRVDVSWGSMEFTYTDGSKGTWDPSNHQYSGQTQGAWSWDTDANKITVTNHSNAAVQASLNFSPTGNVTGSFYDATTGGQAISSNTLSLATAEGTAVSNAPSKNAYLQITSGSISSTGQIGTVTVELQ